MYLNFLKYPLVYISSALYTEKNIDLTLSHKGISVRSTSVFEFLILLNFFIGLLLNLPLNFYSAGLCTFQSDAYSFDKELCKAIVALV